MICACGRPKARTATHCLECYRATRRVQPRPCEHCGVMFTRSKKTRDAARFCTKRCSGQWKAAHGQLAYQQPQAVAARQARAIERAIEREQRKAQRAVAGRRKRPHQPRTRRCSHLCPDCGEYFVAPESRVFCSRVCMRRYKVGRYPGIQAFDAVGDRNALAALIALIRKVRRTLNVGM